VLVLGRHIEFTLFDPDLAALVAANFGAMVVNAASREPDLRYSEIHTGTKSSFLLAATGGQNLHAQSRAELLWLVEKHLTVALQHARPDLLFLHSAAIELNGRAFLMVASSGTGKSTTTWALLRHGFRYISDELSPVDLNALRVHAYPHALCVKRRPPLPYRLPDNTVDLGRTLHVPAQSLSGGVVSGPRHLAGIFILERDGRDAPPRLHALRRAEAAARMYANALNPLAHANLGLDATLRIAEAVPCFLISIGDLATTCALIRDAAAAASPPSAVSEPAWSGIC